LILSCEHSGVDPELYLENALGRLSTIKAPDIASLTPGAWAAARNKVAIHSFTLVSAAKRGPSDSYIRFPTLRASAPHPNPR
jgi:hypothetical protein